MASAAADEFNRAERLRDDTARLAGEIAETEDKVAAVRRRLAHDHPADAERHLAEAVSAEEFAVEERAQQRRYEEPDQGRTS